MSEIRVKKSTLAFTLGFLAILTILILVGAVFAEPRIFFVVFLAYPVWRWYQILRTPIAITLREDKAIEFRSFVGRLALDPGQIKAVRRVGGGYWLEYDAGSFNLYGNMEGFEDFLSRLKALNPAVRVGGVPGFS